jgi:hypothetical protein
MLRRIRIRVAFRLERFQRSGDLFASRKRVKIKNLEPRFDSIETEKAPAEKWAKVFLFYAGFQEDC